MGWNLLTFAQLAFFGLGAWYFLKSVRKKTGEGLRCEDNIIEMDKLMLMKEEGLTEPLSEQTETAGGDHRTGKGDQSPAGSPLRSQSPAHFNLRPTGGGENGGGKADSGGSEKTGGFSFSGKGKVCGDRCDYIAV